MRTKTTDHCQHIHYPLVRYYRDCLAVQLEWARAVNVLEQKDVFLVPLSAAEQQQLGTTSSLRLSHPDALELAKRTMAGGSEVSLMLGAVPGRTQAQDSGQAGTSLLCAAAGGPSVAAAAVVGRLRCGGA